MRLTFTAIKCTWQGLKNVIMSAYQVNKHVTRDKRLVTDRLLTIFVKKSKACMIVVLGVVDIHLLGRASVFQTF